MDEPGKTEAAFQAQETDLRLPTSSTKDQHDAAHDRRDMYRLGRIQEVKRRFRLFSIVGYIVVLASTWEGELVGVVLGLNNGGTAGTVWITIIASLGMLTSTLSMAEMASISPTAGGQYHWVSEFGPPSLQKPLSYAVGWLAALGWQTAMPSVSYAGVLQILALINLVNPNYVSQGWHGALLVIAFVSFSILFNFIAINKMPAIEAVVVVIHLCGFFVFVILFWVCGPRDSGRQTFLTFADENGWGSYGVATLVAIVGPTSSMIGADAAVHLGEELMDAAYVLPRAMVGSAMINYITGIVTVISLVSAIGPNLDTVINSPTGQPWVEIMRLATKSNAACIFLTCWIAFQFTFTSINQVTTSSRQLWAFARDKGVPFHQTLSKVSDRDGVPRNAVFVTLGSSVVIAMIIIGSSIAFNIILSICNVALVVTYIICIATFLVRRLSKAPLPPGRFSMGNKLGPAINVVALCWLTVLATFIFFPAAPNPTPETMNWACLMFGVVVIFAFVWYWARGRYEYDGPVEYIRKDVE